jgi:hypothetical protein
VPEPAPAPRTQLSSPSALPAGINDVAPPLPPPLLLLLLLLDDDDSPRPLESTTSGGRWEEGGGGFDGGSFGVEGGVNDGLWASERGGVGRYWVRGVILSDSNSVTVVGGAGE